MKIDCHINDIDKNCMREASLNTQYIHPYAGIRNEGGVVRL